MLFPDTAKNRRIGIGLICLATLLFSSLDACGKWLVQTYPVAEVVFLRFCVQAVIGTGVLACRPSVVKISNLRLQVLRGVILGSMTLLNFAALQYLQLAQTGAIQFSVPILIAALSAWVLKEHLDARKWVSIALGFAGVLYIIKPWGSGFHPAILLTLMNAVLFAIFNIMTRRLVSTGDPLTTQVVTGWVASVMVAPLAWWYWKTPVDPGNWGLFLVAGLCGGVGHWIMAIAHRYASAAVLGPFLYSQIIYMIFWGWLLFDQMPDSSVVIGGGVVIASGLYLLWREMRGRDSGALAG